MDILAAEQNLKTKLEGAISGIRIEAFPDDPKEYELLHKEGAILIRYDRSVYEGVPQEKPLREKKISQERRARWIFTIFYRNLFSHTKSTEGVYTYLENIREALTGYTIEGQAHTNISMMYPISDGFVDYDEGVWEYEIVFEHTYPEVEAFQ